MSITRLSGFELIQDDQPSRHGYKQMKIISK